MSGIIDQLKFVKSFGIIHFVGIGGIGMSGIAEILHNLGYHVQGSDLGEGDNVQRLRTLGIKVVLGHIEDNVNNVAVVVKSSAVNDGNPEIIAARANKIPIIKRAEMLAEIMRFKTSIAISGTHGKTTTTSLVANLFEAANLSPTVINGGIINSHGTNAYLGSGDYIIAEADESDKSFVKLAATIAVATNIDPEHLDFYGSFDKIKEAFLAFFDNLPFYGFGVACIDHLELRNLVKKVYCKEIITYGIESSDADIRATNITQVSGGYEYDVVINPRLVKLYANIAKIFLPMAGIHNVLNSLAAIAIAVKLGFSEEQIKNGFANFKGVKRRFTKVGLWNNVTIVDDYAHHPVEIKATINTARSIIPKNSGNKIIVIMQPHRYSRVHDLLSDFSQSVSDADLIYIAPIYAAGEEKIEGINSEALVKITSQDNPGLDVRYLDSEENIPNIISEMARPGDMVLFLGAGSVTKWAYNLPKQLEEIRA